MPKVSVIIPVYNTEKYLRKCLDSVLNQVFEDFEVLLINDGSTDKSGEICDEYALKDKRIRVFHKENGGVSSARNLGLDNAKGEWIYFLDADDYLELDAFEYFIDMIKKNNAIDLIEFGTKKWKDEVIIGERKPSKHQIYTDIIQLIKENELKPFSACLHLIKKDLLIKNNIKFDKDLRHNEDMLFMYKVFLSSEKALVLNKAFYNQVFSENSATRSDINKIRLINNLQFIKKLLEYTDEEKVTEHLSSEIRKIPNYFFVSLVFYKYALRDLKEFQNSYNEIYDNYKEVFNNTPLKLARINFLILLIPLFFKFRILKRNHQL